ncbi:hypothetical protein LTS06_012321 [Exophiala xenobiotica]|nr:hypothetical protein LTS06_012321 [Exophiala xenobiotica]
MEPQASFRSLPRESEIREEPARQIVPPESLDIVSIKNEVETVFSMKQHHPAAVAAALGRVLAAMKDSMDRVDHMDRMDNVGQSAAEIAARLKYLNSILIPLNDLDLWHKQPRNVFRDIHMGEYTLLGLLSPLALGTFHTISSGPAGIQYLHMRGQPGADGVPEKAIPIAGDDVDGVKNELTETNLTNSISRFIRKGYKLVRRPQIVFQGIELEEREMMLILSCTTPIIVQNVRGKESSVFIAGQVSRATLQWLCDELEVEFESNEPDGVFQTEYTQ